MRARELSDSAIQAFLRGRGRRAETLGSPKQCITCPYTTNTERKSPPVGESGVRQDRTSKYHITHGVTCRTDKTDSGNGRACSTPLPLAHFRPPRRCVWTAKSVFGISQDRWITAWSINSSCDDTSAAVLVLNHKTRTLARPMGNWDTDLQKCLHRKPFAKLLAARRSTACGLVVSAHKHISSWPNGFFVKPCYEDERGKRRARLRCTPRRYREAIDGQSIPETASPVLYHR